MNRPWYKGAAFYHIYPLGLTNAPKENHESQTEDRFPILNGFIPHIKAMNLNAIYIGPLFESSTHGYDTKDYRTIDRRLGTNDDFKDFVALCHENGIRVVVDGVFNHTGREFFAFEDIREHRENSAYKDWYKGVRFDWGDPFGYDAWQGHAELPCLNLWNQDVRNYLFDTIRFWIHEFDIDGIRLDCANVLDFDFMKALRQATASMKQDFWLMGEVIHGEYSRFVNDEVLHSVTNYELHKAFYSGHNDHNYFEIAHNVRRLQSVGTELYTFLDNHDENRIASKLNNKKHLYPVTQLLFTLPGIPSIYYGSEWAVEGVRTNWSDEMLRPAFSPEEIPGRNCDYTEEISRLAKIHCENEEFHGGTYEELLLTNRQYAFCRHGEHSIVISAVNNDDNACEVTIPVPIKASVAENLRDGSMVPVENGTIKASLQGNSGEIYKVLEG